MSKIQSFEEKIRAMEIEEYPEFTNEAVYAPTNNGNFYFAPSWHIHSGLITEDIIHKLVSLQNKLLSVGSGNAYLEKLMVKRLGVEQSQVSLADIDAPQHQGFRQYTFDMHRPWPALDASFDYIIFPESTLLNTHFEEQFERINGLYALVKNAIPYLNSKGQIRINGHCQIDSNIAACREKIQESYKVSVTHTPSLIVVEKKAEP